MISDWNWDSELDFTIKKQSQIFQRRFYMFTNAFLYDVHLHA